MRRWALLWWRLGRQDLRVLWHALRHPMRPGWLIPAVALVTIYAIEPLNFVIPLLGVVDDLVLVPLALHWLVRLLPPAIVHSAPIRSRPLRRG